MSDIIIMSQKELNRYEVIKRLMRKEINGTEASRILRLSLRQTKRLKVKTLKHGLQGLIHGNRGKPGNRRLPDKERKQIIKLLRRYYDDFKPTHASEKLEEGHGIKHDPKTIRAIMVSEGLWKPRRGKKKATHREWRQRKSFFGEMEQFDGSYHNWFEERLPGKQCLLLAVDDATSALTHARFGQHEDILSVFTFWQEYVKKHGKPVSIYLDQFSTYKMIQPVARENEDSKTQFERAMQELGIETITAYSAEAKGRVETTFGTLQDRLVKEMRLKEISTIKEANTYLIKEFIPWYNAKYALKARGEADLHKQLTRKEKKQLHITLSKQTPRTIQNDFTISLEKQWYQILPTKGVAIHPRDKMIVEERIDHSINMRLRGKYLNYKLIAKTLNRAKKANPWVLTSATSNQLTTTKV